MKQKEFNKEMDEIMSSCNRIVIHCCNPQQVALVLSKFPCPNYKIIKYILKLPHYKWLGILIEDNTITMAGFYCNFSASIPFYTFD